MTARELSNICPVCNAQEGQVCTVPTAEGRSQVLWEHFARSDARALAEPVEPEEARGVRSSVALKVIRDLLSESMQDPLGALLLEREPEAWTMGAALKIRASTGAAGTFGALGLIDKTLDNIAEVEASWQHAEVVELLRAIREELTS